jgi:hypothetical protein
LVKAAFAADNADMTDLMSVTAYLTLATIALSAGWLVR